MSRFTFGGGLDKRNPIADRLMQTQESSQPQPAIIDQNKLQKPNKRTAALAENLMAQGSSTAPVQSWGEGLARALTGAVGGYTARKADEKQAAYDAERTKAYIGALTEADPVQSLMTSGLNEDAMNMAMQQLESRQKLDFERGKWELQGEWKPRIAGDTEAAKTPYMVDRAQRTREATLPYDFAKMDKQGTISRQNAAYGNTLPTTKQRDAIAAGLVPGTEQYNAFITGANNGFSVTTPDGTVISQGGGGGNIKQNQYTAATYALRANDSHEILNQFLESPGLVQKITEGSVLGNLVRPEEAQLIEQAKRNFVNAILRRESGAVIAESEFTNADKQYFPQPGDSFKTLQQKAQNRQRQIASFRAEAGAAYDLADEQYRKMFGGQAAPATGVSPEDLQYMTPEERALFQ